MNLAKEIAMNLAVLLLTFKKQPLGQSVANPLYNI
jgi:hypothetical protein